MRTAVYCPCCESRAKVKTRERLGVSLSKLYCACFDPLCGCTFVAFLETAYLLSPSGQLNPAVPLPMSERAWAHKRKQAPSVQQDLLPFKRK